MDACRNIRFYGHSFLIGELTRRESVTGGGQMNIGTKGSTMNMCAANAAAKAVFPLCPELRAKMEREYREDFSDIMIDTGPRARLLTAAQGSMACTDDAAIFFARGCYRPDTVAGQTVVAHELAHIVQKRLYRRCTRGHARAVSAIRLEAEADRAAMAAMSGRTCAAMTPDASPSFRSWGRSGHYYTVYFAALAAGLSDARAASTAFFCQMPDQVSDFDAKAAGIEWTKANAATNITSFYAWEMHAVHLEEESKFWKKATKLPDNIKAHDIEVQKGLHCLTGNAPEAETAARIKIAKEMSIDSESMESGLALHALGDSFAHQKYDGSSMYAAPYGHLLPTRNLGTEVDDISNRQENYHNYSIALLDVMKAAHGVHPVKPALADGTFTSAITAFCAAAPGEPGSDEAEKVQIALIRAYCAKHLHPLRSYAPEKAEKDAIEWMLFHHKYRSKYKFGNHPMQRVQKLVREWSRL